MNPPVSLPKGAYIVTVQYICDGPGAELTLQSPQDQACIQWQGLPLDPEENIAQGRFTLTGITGDLTVQVLGASSVSSIVLARDGGVGFLREFLLLAAVAAMTAAALWLYVKRAGLVEQEKEYLLLVCGAALLASAPLFLPYLVDGHDARVHLMRIEGLASALAEGQFPARIHPAVYAGYGLPFSIYYPELFLYLPAALRLLGMSLTSAFQVLQGLINLASAVAMFHAGRRVFRSAKTGAFAAVLYTLSIYRMSNMYTRTALGEALAMTFLPLAVCGMWELFHGESRRWMMLAFSFTAILQSHVLSTCMTAVFCVGYAVLHIKKLWDRDRLVTIGKVAAVTVLLNLWTLVPLAQYMGMHLTSGLAWPGTEERAVYIYQLLAGTSLPEGQSPLVGSELTLMPLELGVVLLAGCLLFVLIIWQKRRQPDSRNAGFDAALTFFLGGTFAAFASSMYFPWELLSGMPYAGWCVRYLQFPFRLLGYADVLLCLAAGYAMGFFCRQSGKLAVTAVLVLSVLVVEPLVQAYCEQDIYVYRGETVTTHISDMPEYKFNGTDVSLIRAGDQPSATGPGSWSSYTRRGTTVTLNVSSQQTGYFVDVPLFWFPGYTAETEDGQQLETMRGQNNVVRVLIPRQTAGTVTIQFTGYLLWRAAETASTLTVLALALLPAVRRVRGRKKQMPAV